MTETILKPVCVNSSKEMDQEISSEATPDYLRLLQGYLNKCIWIFCGPHSTMMGVNSSRECGIRFICPNHSLKPVVLPCSLIEYQIRKISSRVEVRRFQFLVMLQLVGIQSQSYSQSSPDTSPRHSCRPRNF
ncbi:hypothetical protein TNCV_3326661 [Trichonephila clavipes]|nr:hypothetical protein TNCV_3326661 [Trichonephila clavipes]